MSFRNHPQRMCNPLLHESEHYIMGSGKTQCLVYVISVCIGLYDTVFRQTNPERNFSSFTVYFQCPQEQKLARRDLKNCPYLSHEIFKCNVLENNFIFIQILLYVFPKLSIDNTTTLFHIIDRRLLGTMPISVKVLCEIWCQYVVTHSYRLTCFSSSVYEPTHAIIVDWHFINFI